MTRTCPLATHPRFSRLLPWPPLPLVPFSHPTPPVPQHSGKGSCLGEWQQLTQRKSSSMETYSLPNLLYPTCSPMAPHLCSGVRGTSSSRSKESKVGQSCGNSSSCSCSRACCLWGDKSQHRHRSVLFHRCPALLLGCRNPQENGEIWEGGTQQQHCPHLANFDLGEDHAAGTVLPPNEQRTVPTTHPRHTPFASLLTQ